MNSSKFNLLTFLILFTSIYAQQVGSPCTDRLTRKSGVCKLPNDCPSLKEKISKGITPTVCNFFFQTTIICCEHSTINPPQPNDNSLLYPDEQGGFFYPEDEDEDVHLSVSERKCAEYSKNTFESVVILPLLTVAEPTRVNFSKCEYDGVALIVGGKPAAPGEFPFMAAIGYSDGEWKCGGTLISERFILTAAHCAKKSKPIKVRLGDLNLKSNDDESDPIDISIAQVITHPGYRPPKKYNDICLLRLSKLVNFNKYIRPACLWNKDNINENKALALGWGTTSFGGENSDSLLKVPLELFNIRKCMTAYGADKKQLPHGIVSSMLCAGDTKGKKDTCQGDSGGPLIIQKKDNNCVHYIVGITSFGITCAAPDTPGIYTKISDYVSWIERIVWAELH